MMRKKIEKFWLIFRVYGNIIKYDKIKEYKISVNLGVLDEEIYLHYNGLPTDGV